MRLLKTCKTYDKKYNAQQVTKLEATLTKKPVN